ncbi:MAG TPA: helix-turn-helix transcriptional regulator [Vicinamibacterales bacterium]
MRDHGRAIRTRVGRTIRQLRLLRGWSQEQLAERANSSPKHVGRIERGQVNVGLNGLAEIAAALSVNIADLFVEPRGRRSARGAIHVISGDDLVHLEQVGAVARRIKSPRARPSTRSSR